MKTLKTKNQAKRNLVLFAIAVLVAVGFFTQSVNSLANNSLMAEQTAETKLFSEGTALAKANDDRDASTVVPALVVALTAIAVNRTLNALEEDNGVSFQPVEHFSKYATLDTAFDLKN